MRHLILVSNIAVEKRVEEEKQQQIEGYLFNRSESHEKKRVYLQKPQRSLALQKQQQQNASPH
jgi:hypothetical protein